MSRKRRLKNSFSVIRRWGIAINVIISIVAALIIVVLLNYFARRYFERFHFASAGDYKLTPYTEEVLSAVTNDVHVTIFFDRDKPVFHSISALLNEYESSSERISVETVDYIRNPAVAETVKQKYPFSFLENENVVIFDNGKETEMVYGNELSSYRMAEGSRRRIRRASFKGEQLFTSALSSLSSSKPAQVYFVQGHREHDPEDTSVQGYSKFADLLRQNNAEVNTLRLSGQSGIPDDCDLLVMAGPQSPLSESEVSKTSQYLENGGRLLGLLRSQVNTGLLTTGLRPLLGRWGVDLGRNMVLDRPNSVSSRGPYDMVVTNFGVHEVVKPLYQSQLRVFFPRSVEKAGKGSQAADEPKVEELFLTGVKGEVITDIREGVPYRSPDARTGQIPLAVAVEEGTVEGLDAGERATRMIVVGDSFFLSNTAINHFANRDFAALAINWLFDRSNLSKRIPPDPIEEYQLNLTRAERGKVRWVFLAGMPGGILLLGMIVWWIRRH